MSDIIKKCPKDGVEYEATHVGNCESCLGPLQFYCKKHDQWLVDEVCNKCSKPVPATPVPAEPKSRSDLMVVLGLVVVFVLLGAGVYTVIKKVFRQAPGPVVAAPVVRPTPTPAPTPPAPPPPKPPPVVVKEAPVAAAPLFPSYPPVPLNLSELLVAPEQYLGKLVKTWGMIQVKEPARESFDLRQGDYALSVLYRHVTDPAKATIAAAPLNRAVNVTGLLQLDETYNSYYLLAREVEAR